MRTKELTKKIENSFSELAPDMFDSIMLKIEQESQSESILVEEPVQKKHMFKGMQKRMLPVSATFAMVCMLVLLIMPWKNNEISVVMKVNPSIQIIMNTSYEVVDLKGLNQDGKDVVDTLQWEKNESIDILMQTLLVDLTEKSYLKQDGKIQLTVSSKKEEIYYEVENILEKEIEKNLTNLGYTEVRTTCQAEGTKNGTTTETSETSTESKAPEATTEESTEVTQTTPAEPSDASVPKKEEQTKETQKQEQEIESQVSQENKMPTETEKKPSLGKDESEKEKPSENQSEKPTDNSTESSTENTTEKPADNKPPTGNEVPKDNSTQTTPDKNPGNKNEGSKDNGYLQNNKPETGDRYSPEKNWEHKHEHSHEQNWNNRYDNGYDNTYDDDWRKPRGGPADAAWENKEEEENLYPPE